MAIRLVLFLIWSAKCRSIGECEIPMYSIGELIIYGNEGVCRVENVGVSENPSASKDRQYYTLIPLYRNGKVITPVDGSVFSRPVITKLEAERIIDSIPTVEAEIYNDRNLKNLTDHYKESMQTYDCTDIVRTIKAIRLKRRHAIEHGKKLGTIDERFLKRAEDMLYGELSVAMEQTWDEVKDAVVAGLRLCNAE